MLLTGVHIPGVRATWGFTLANVSCEDGYNFPRESNVLLFGEHTRETERVKREKDNAASAQYDRR